MGQRLQGPSEDVATAPPQAQPLPLHLLPVMKKGIAWHLCPPAARGHLLPQEAPSQPGPLPFGGDPLSVPFRLVSSNSDTTIPHPWVRALREHGRSSKDQLQEVRVARGCPAHQGLRPLWLPLLSSPLPHRWGPVQNTAREPPADHRPQAFPILPSLGAWCRTRPMCLLTREGLPGGPLRARKGTLRVSLAPRKDVLGHFLCITTYRPRDTVSKSRKP